MRTLSRYSPELVMRSATYSHSLPLPVGRAWMPNVRPTCTSRAAGDEPRSSSAQADVPGLVCTRPCDPLTENAPPAASYVAPFGAVPRLLAARRSKAPEMYVV